MQRAFLTGMLLCLKYLCSSKQNASFHHFSNNLPIVINLLKQHKIKNAYVFGSAATDNLMIRVMLI